MLSLEYPTIVGSPVAGTVEALVSSVTNIGLGHRSFVGRRFVLKQARYRGLQLSAIVSASQAVEVSIRRHDSGLIRQRR
jgi:NADPH:quinone reductase-like Zn-dependent oxidoreductase